MPYTERSLATSSLMSQRNRIKLVFVVELNINQAYAVLKTIHVIIVGRKATLSKFAEVVYGMNVRGNLNILSIMHTCWKRRLRNERTRKPQHSQHHAHLLEADSTVASVMSKEVPTHEESNQAGDCTDDGSYPGTLYALETTPDLKPLYVEVSLNSAPLPPPLSETKATLKMYTGEVIPVLGTLKTHVSYKQQAHDLNLFVVKGDLGHPYLVEIGYDS